MKEVLRIGEGNIREITFLAFVLLCRFTTSLCGLDKALFLEVCMSEFKIVSRSCCRELYLEIGS